MKGYCVVDCNSFFCSCERLFRPDLETQPVIVLSSNDGCVISRSNEAKALGIKMGEPYFQVSSRGVAGHVAVFSSNFELYAEISRRIMLVLAEAAEKMEIYSCDEAFLSFDEMPSMTWATALRQQIKREIGIPVSIGGGRTKTLAKLASQWAKKQGVYFWSEQDRAHFSDLPCEEIWGISKGLGQRLRARRILTVGDFLATPVARIRRILGVVGARLWHELQGEPCLEIVDGPGPGHSHGGSAHEIVARPPQRQSLCSSRTFKEQTADLEELRAAIALHCHRVGETLRAEGHYAETVTVFLLTDRFRPEQPQHYPLGTWRLFEPTQTTQQLLAPALELLVKLRQPEISYRKAGVIVGEISLGQQPSLWPESAERRKKLEAVCRAMDRINASSGHQSVTLGLSPKGKRWLPGANLKSPRYLSNWEELPVVGGS